MGKRKKVEKEVILDKVIAGMCKKPNKLVCECYDSNTGNCTIEGYNETLYGPYSLGCINVHCRYFVHPNNTFSALIDTPKSFTELNDDLEVRKVQLSKAALYAFRRYCLEVCPQFPQAEKHSYLAGFEDACTFLGLLPLRPIPSGAPEPLTVEEENKLCDDSLPEGYVIYPTGYEIINPNYGNN